MNAISGMRNNRLFKKTLQVHPCKLGRGIPATYTFFKAGFYSPPCTDKVILASLCWFILKCHKGNSSGVGAAVYKVSAAWMLQPSAQGSVHSVFINGSTDN